MPNTVKQFVLNIGSPYPHRDTYGTAARAFLFYAKITNHIYICEKGVQEDHDSLCEFQTGKAVFQYGSFADILACYLTIGTLNTIGCLVNPVLLSSPQIDVVPSVDTVESRTVQIHIVDEDTNLIGALRTVVIPPEPAQALREDMIGLQTRLRADGELADRLINTWNDLSTTISAKTLAADFRPWCCEDV